MSKPYPLKSGDTKRELRRIIKQGGADFSQEDWDEVTAIALRYKTSAGVITRVMSKGDELGEVYYRWVEADVTAIVASTNQPTYEMELTWEDGGKATVPSIGYYTLKGTPILS